MLQLIMHHTGELFLKTPESEQPLNKRLVLTTDSRLGGQSDPHAMSAMAEELLSVVLWFFDFYLEELVDYDYAPEQSKFALNLMRTKLLAEIETMVSNGVSIELVHRNVTNFQIIDI